MSKKPSAIFLSFSLAAIITLAIVVVVSIITQIPIGAFTRDPAALAKIKPYMGLLSNLGILLWASAAAICFFTTALLKNKGRTENINFFFFAGILTTALLLDDFFMLHEYAFPIYFHIPEKLVLAFYGFMILFFPFAFRKVILSTYYLPLILAFIFFGASIVFDLWLKVLPWHFLLEDGTKFLGIVSWLAYFSKTSFDSLQEASH